jgi:uncharacterized membrane protein
VAVFEVFRTAHSTKATIWAMIWFFLISHPQVTYIAMVFPELNATRLVNAFVSFLIQNVYGSHKKKRWTIIDNEETTSVRHHTILIK